MTRRFSINSPTVVSEIIDGEAILLNLSSGHYFNAEGSGAAIWALIGKTATTDEIVAAIVADYEVEPTGALSSVEGFVAELFQHALIRDCDQDAVAAAPDAIPAANGKSKKPWSPPVLGVHPEMEDLLLLDPIHDVDEMGWPTPLDRSSL